MTEQPFELGDLVTTPYYKDESSIIRKVIEIVPMVDYESGWGVRVDGGEVCSRCRRTPGTTTSLIDSGWFNKAEKGIYKRRGGKCQS
jgi:hypothetical protein